MANINEMRKSASIHDLFMDAARHHVSNEDSPNGYCKFHKCKSAYLEIERSFESTATGDAIVDFSFGRFRVLWMGTDKIDNVEYGCFFFHDRYDGKRTVRHTEWANRELADLLFECAQEFMQVCVKLKNGEIEPFPDDDDEDETED